MAGKLSTVRLKARVWEVPSEALAQAWALLWVPAWSALREKVQGLVLSSV